MKRTGLTQLFGRSILRQPKHRIGLTAICVVTACCLLLAGCKSEKTSELSENQPPSDSQLTPSINKPTTLSVAPSKAIVETSPAADAAKLSEDASPEEVCQRFMDLLKSGNRIAAENLLTTVALTTTSKAGLQLEPMGGPTARYEIGEASYATIKNKLAQVDCEIVEQIDGQEVRTSLTWLVRKQNLGWRISGLMLAVEAGQLKDLLSFENVQDVEKIKSLAASGVLDETESRQAEVPSENKLK